jgi:tetratricopeptide (TPR) repeat protein
LADLDRADLLCIDGDTVNGERAAILQAVGRYDDAWVLRQEAVAREASFEHVAALVSLHAERGDTELAERQHAESCKRYRGVSPFPLAVLEFQLGLMWMNEGRLDRARQFFESARWLVPAYAAAAGHVAEVEAQLGNIDSAVGRLASLARSSDDPIYAAQLARILAGSGRDLESHYWRGLAAARYDELMAIHPEAFAGHAAEFWLAAGGDPARALRLARQNRATHDAPRAGTLLAQARSAAA